MNWWVCLDGKSQGIISQTVQGLCNDTESLQHRLKFMDEKLYIAKYASVKIRLSKSHVINELYLLQNHVDLSMGHLIPTQ